MESSSGFSQSKPPSVNPTRSLPVKVLTSVPDPSLYLSDRLSSDRLPEAYRLLAQARQSLEGLSEAASKVQEGLHSVRSNLKLLARKEEEGDRGAEISLAAPRDDIDGLFSQVKKAVFLADAQIDRFCFKHKSGYSDKERKRAVTGALEKMANDIWTALIANINKPAKVQLAEAKQAIATLHSQSITLSAGLSAALEEIEEVLYNHLAESVRVPAELLATERKSRPEAQNSQRGAQTTRETRSLPGPKEELAADLQEDGRRMLTSFERYASSRGGRSSSVTAVRKEMNKILKDMVTTVQLNCAGFGPTADAETWKMKKQALRIKKRIDGLCKGLEEKESASMHDNSIASVPTNYMGRDTPSFDTGRNTPSFDTPDRGTPSRGQSVEPPFPSELSDMQSEGNSHSRTTSQGIANTDEKSVISRETHSSDRARPAVTQARSIHARQEVLNMDIADIRRKLDDLFPASRSRGRTESAPIGLLKTLAPGLAAYTDQEFIQQFTEQVSKERQATAALLGSLRRAGFAVSSVEDAENEFLSLQSALTSLKQEHEDYVLQTLHSQTDRDISSDLDKSLLKQLQTELKQLKEAEKAKSARQTTASQTIPIQLSIETAEIISIETAIFTLSEETVESVEMAYPEVKETEVAAGNPDISSVSEAIKTHAMVKTALAMSKHKQDGRGRRQPTKKASRLSTVQEAVVELEDSLEHEEENKANAELSASKPLSVSEKRQQISKSASDSSTGKQDMRGTGKTPVILPMSYFKAKAMSKDSGSLSAGKLQTATKLEEQPASTPPSVTAKSIISISLLPESRGKVPISPSTELLIKGMVGSKFAKLPVNPLPETIEKPPTPKSACKKLPIKEAPVLFSQASEDSTKSVASKGKSNVSVAKTGSELKGKQGVTVLAERRSEGSAKPAGTAKQLPASSKKTPISDKPGTEEVRKPSESTGKPAVPKLVIPLKPALDSGNIKKESSPPVTFRPIPEVLASETASGSSTEVVIDGEEIEAHVNTLQEAELAAAVSNPPAEEGKTEAFAALNQQIAEKVEVLKLITDEEAAIEAEISTIAFATLEEQYIEAKLAEWAACPDLARMYRLTHDLRQAHRRYDEAFREVQSLQDQMREEKLRQTCKLVLLPVSPQLVEDLQAMLCAPVEVCGRVSFETWEWALVRVQEICVWVRPDLPTAPLSRPEIAEKYSEAERMLASCPQLPSDLVLATAQLLQRV